jgi:N-methylhydantoinase A/acetone carboxylase, beta subunit
MAYRVAIDIGGAFTDLFAIDNEGNTFWSKVLTTPHDLIEGVLEVFKNSKIDPQKTSQILHGQTLVINAIIQRKGAKVGLITTKGFKDLLIIQRANRRDIFNLKYKKPEPLIPRYRIWEVDERTDAEGRIIRHVKKEDVKAICDNIIREGVDSVAICFINSYVNAYNEKEIKNILQEVINGTKIKISISSEITKQWGEYERTSTVVLNAIVMPLMSNYISRLKYMMNELGFSGSFLMMLSNGGVAKLDYVEHVPIATIESGPVAGVIAGVELAKLLDEKNVIVLDGGSTTTKASLIENLKIRTTTNYSIERSEFFPGYPVKVPVVDIVEIGNGGGSIAWIDEVGSLRVGPVSAGADPGPACYNRGGDKPTLTDAYLILGYLNPNYFLGGKIKLNAELSRNVTKYIADFYNVSIEEAALAIVKIANDNAAQLLRLISVQRGFDPRDFTLIAHGGSGPMLSAFIAEELEIPKILIPFIPPGNFSAWGLLMSDLRYDFSKTNIKRFDEKDIIDTINKGYQELLSEAKQLYMDETNIDFDYSMDLRYYGQEHTVRVEVMKENIDDDELLQIEKRFKDRHLKEYGFNLDSPIELVNLNMTLIIKSNKPQIKPVIKNGNLDKAIKEQRNVYWGKDFYLTNIYQRESIPSLKEIEGPAIIEEPTTTILIREEYKGYVDKFGNFVIKRK